MDAKCRNNYRARIIRVSSNVGEVVVDPFGGSGTTLAVAKNLIVGT